MDQNGLTLTLDGTTPITIRSVSKPDNLTTVTGASTGVLAADSTHTVELVFKDNLGASFTNAWRFTVEAYHQAEMWITSRSYNLWSQGKYFPPRMSRHPHGQRAKPLIVCDT